MNFVLLHGFTGSPEGIFFPWLKNELKSLGYEVQVPSLPNSSNPVEDEQVAYVLENVRFDGDTVLFGHSLGTVVALKVVEKLKISIKGLVLAGAFLSPDFKDEERPFSQTFSWKFDFGKIKSNTGHRKVLAAINDYAVPLEQNQKVAHAIDAEYLEVMAEGEHFCSKQEPVILKAILDDNA